MIVMLVEKKGTHLGINRLKHFILSESNNYKEEAWVFKLDIKSFFINLDKNILFTFKFIKNNNNIF